MNDTAAQRLLQIERALRHHGGIRDLISQDPRAEAWLRWIARSPQMRTCGAIEEIREEGEYEKLLQTEPSASHRMPLGLRLCLYPPQGRAHVAQPFENDGCRFDLSFATDVGGPGIYRLTTEDQTQLWRFDLAALWHRQPQDHVWRLAAAPPPPEIKPLPGQSETKPDRSEDDESQDQDAAVTTLVQRWPVSSWAMEVQLHRTGQTRWLSVASMQGGL